MGRVGLGFAGVGWLGESLIRELPAFPRLALAAVQDVDAARATEIAARYGAPWHGTSYEALLRAPGVDAVVICTPNALHVPQAWAALEAGKHVLVQKPLALSAGDARATLEDAARIGRLLFVDYSYRYLDTIRVLRDALASIGPVHRVSAAFHNVYGPGKGWFFDQRLSGGGALIDLGVHLLDLAVDLLRPSAVQLDTAELAHGQGHAVEDAAQLELRLDDVPMRLDASWNADRPLTEIALELEGGSGRLRWENVDGSFFRFRTLRDDACLLDRETTLRVDTLRAFDAALEAGSAPPVDLAVYELLDRAYTRTPGSDRARDQ